MAESILIELHYLGTIQYFSKFLLGKKIVVEQHENYMKGSYRNRMYIGGSHGPLRLSIPLEKGKNERLPIRNVKISNTADWQRQHWISIQSAYGKSPYFEYYADELKQFYERPYQLLFDWNLDLLNWMLATIGVTTYVEYSTEYCKSPPEHQRDLRNMVSPKAKNSYLDSSFKLIPYAQVFEDKIGFQPNLSIIDLLFCKGPETILCLMNCNQ